MICRTDQCECGRKPCPTPDECQDTGIYSPDDAQEMVVGVLCILTALAVLASVFI